ncbi:MAG: DUF192 domain-containing protein [Bacteroidales bacterium]
MRILLGLLLILGVSVGLSSQTRMPRGRVTFPDGTVVAVEIADTEPVRAKGLMFRTGLAANEGMIFVFPQSGFYPFWMKNTLIPLDMIWLDARGRIVSIAASVPPCKADPCPSYSPDGNASYVLEVVSGFGRQHNVKKGDVLKLEGIPTLGR